MERSSLGLAHRAWRLLPADLRRRSMTRLAGMIGGRPDPVPPAASDGIVVAGDIDGRNGLAETARVMDAAFRRLGVARGTIQLGLPSVTPPPGESPAAGAAILTMPSAPILPVGLARWPRKLLRGRRVIGMFAWELPVMPPAWHYGARFVHEVWAPSAFCAEAFETLAPGRVRVVPYPLAALPPRPVEGGRADFGLPEDAMVVLVVFNLASSRVRKNPEAAIRAFRQAFGARRDRLLVLKLSGTSMYSEDLADIRALVGDAPNIRVMAETISEPALRGLIAASDIVLSLHRAEGFGLIPATAMLLGRAVVATGWSGNMSFMDTDSAALVDFRLVQADDPRGTYNLAGARWAEPDVGHAAEWLRRLADDPVLRANFAARGMAYVRDALGDGPLQAALAQSGIR